MDRKLIRPSLPPKARPSAPSGPRRGPLPETTHAEAGYLQQAVESKAAFVVQLLGGDELRGRLEGHDRDVLLLAREGLPPIVLRKDKVRTYWMER